MSGWIGAAARRGRGEISVFVPLAGLVLACIGGGIVHGERAWAGDERDDLSAAGEERKDKDYREGWGFAGLPLANYSSDDGFGYGLKVAAYDYGKNQKPYKTQIALQLFFTTNKVMYHKLFIDMPDFRGTPWRIDGALKFDRVLLNNYFGIGNDTSTLDEGASSDSSGLSDEESAVVANYYTSFQSQEPSLILNLRRTIRGPVQFFNGYQVKHTIIVPHTAETVYQYRGIELPDDWMSYLEEEKPYGYSGGTMAYAQVGVIFDSRDQEPSPTRGLFSEFSVRGVAYRALDEQERETHAPLYGGFNLTSRHFLPVLTPRVVFASRLVLDALLGDVPFNELASFGGSQDYTGLGGSTSLRGILSRRYRGHVKAIVTPELRMTPATFYAGTQKFDIGVVVFSDLGRVWDESEAEPSSTVHWTAGGGLRIAWNDNFLIRLDVGKNIGRILELRGEEVADRDADYLGFYLVFDHAF